MNDSQTDAFSEAAKAVGQLAKVGSQVVDASRQAGGWLDRLFGQGIEDAVGLHWSDRVKAKRIERSIYDWERLTELMKKVEVRLKSNETTTLRTVSPKVALAIIEQATIEDDEHLHSLWANLLATALDAAAGAIHRKFASVLNELTYDDATVFQTICVQWFKLRKPPEAEHHQSYGYGPTVDGSAVHNAISIITLSRLGLISPGYMDFISYEPNEDRSFKNPEAFRGYDVRAYGNLDVVEVTAFGEAFFKAVIAG